LAAEAGNAVSTEDLDLYARVTAHHRRQLEATGLQRRPRNVTPSVGEYLAARNSTAHNGTAHNGTALDLKVDQTNEEAIDADAP
jgi:hypothetical protein